MDSGVPIAWVESPLQLLGAAEWASGLDQPIIVAHRLTGPQMERTAAELMARGANFAECLPYYGIPWELLRKHRQWAVGDGFSGQFRLAASAVRPQRVTFLDDGAHSIALADALLGRIPYARPNVKEAGPNAFLGSLTRDRMLGLAARERLVMTTAFPFGDDRTDGLRSLGAAVDRHTLDWVRRTARPQRFTGSRVLLGSSLPSDALVPAESYLQWVTAEAAAGELAYFPHRRETASMLKAVASIPGVTINDAGLPIELVLAGTTTPLELISLNTSAQVTLGHLLRGTGSVLRTGSLSVSA
ncbi:MAG: hypothetical protein V4479_05455 [Actinomycetota bacterium]